MPYGYGSTNTSTSSRDTGSDYGQFDRAVSQAANNPAPSTPDDRGDDDKALSYVNWNQPTISSSVVEGGGDIDSTYLASDAYFTPEPVEKSFVEKMVDYYKGGGVLGLGIRKIGGMLNPENQYEGITGEDDYGAGDYVSTIADWAESRGLTDDYASEDLETQMVIDKQMWDAGIRSPSFEALYEGGDISNIDNLTGSESAAIEQLIPQESYRIGNTTPIESQVDKWFASNPVGTGLDPNYMTTYNTAKAQIANTLGMVDTSNQFGYSSDPYGGLTAQNLATNPFNIPWVQERGLI
jgi:hypothetical protein